MRARKRALRLRRNSNPTSWLGSAGGAASISRSLPPPCSPIPVRSPASLVWISLKNPGTPLILIPTTAGTGSEVTSICVLSDTANQVKKGIVSRHLYAKTVLLDPELTVGLPPRVYGHDGYGRTGARHRIPIPEGGPPLLTDVLNLEAIGFVGANLRRAYNNGQDREARTHMLYASCMAGMAFSNTQNGLDHAAGSCDRRTVPSAAWSSDGFPAPLGDGIQPGSKPGQVCQDRARDGGKSRRDIRDGRSQARGYGGPGSAR